MFFSRIFCGFPLNERPFDNTEQTRGPSNDRPLGTHNPVERNCARPKVKVKVLFDVETSQGNTMEKKLTRCDQNDLAAVVKAHGRDRMLSYMKGTRAADTQI
jgi:hypothetical protein